MKFCDLFIFDGMVLWSIAADNEDKPKSIRKLAASQIGIGKSPKNSMQAQQLKKKRFWARSTFSYSSPIPLESRKRESVSFFANVKIRALIIKSTADTAKLQDEINQFVPWIENIKTQNYNSYPQGKSYPIIADFIRSEEHKLKEWNKCQIFASQWIRKWASQCEVRIKNSACTTQKDPIWNTRGTSEEHSKTSCHLPSQRQHKQARTMCCDHIDNTVMN